MARQKDHWRCRCLSTKRLFWWGHVAALVKSHAIGLLPFRLTKEQTTQTMDPSPKTIELLHYPGQWNLELTGSCYSTVLMFYENSKAVSHVHQCHHQMDLDNVKVVGHKPNNTINSFSLKLGCLWKIQTLGMTTSSSQKSINVWRAFNLKLSQKHSLLSHAYRSHSVIFNFK